MLAGSVMMSLSLDHRSVKEGIKASEVRSASNGEPVQRIGP